MSIFGKGKTINHIGNTLTCSDGTIYYGVSSMDEAQRVAALHQKKF